MLVCIFPINLLGVDLRTFGFYRSYYQRYRSTLFNPGNRSVQFLGYRTGPDFSFSQYFDFQMDFLSLQWQIDVMGELERSDQWKDDVKMKQLFFQRGLFENWVLVAGRAIQRWGTGYAFNPTDVVAPDKELNDPDNSEKRAEGNDMIKLEYFGETYSIAMCYLTKVDFDPKIEVEGSKLAFRFYKNLWDIDLSFISLFSRAESPIWGLNSSFVIGDRLEIHGEVSAQKGSYRAYHRTINEANTLYLKEPFETSRRNDPHIYLQFLLGFQYTLPRNIMWVAEYFHQDQGYSKREWDRVMEHVHFLNNQLETPFHEAAEGNLLWSLNVFSTKGAMQDYLMNYLDGPVHRNVGLRSTWMMNLNDFSAVLIPEINVTIGDHFTFYGRGFFFYGREGTEFGELFQSYTIEAGLRFR